MEQTQSRFANDDCMLVATMITANDVIQSQVSYVHTYTIHTTYITYIRPDDHHNSSWAIITATMWTIAYRHRPPPHRIQFHSSLRHWRSTPSYRGARAHARTHKARSVGKGQKGGGMDQRGALIHPFLISTCHFSGFSICSKVD